MKNPLKTVLKDNKISIGSWITLGHTSIAEIMAGSGFDWLAVDMEHSVITLDIAQELIKTIEGCGVVPLVRVSENNPNIIKRVIDTGAYGVIVPMINTKEQAEMAVRSVKYPPEGYRGVGLARAQGYGQEFSDYASTVNKESVVIIQIEHKDSVKNLESILSVKGIDGCLIGPYDISGSLGVPGDFDHPDVILAIEKVEKICKQKKVPLGKHVIQPDHNLIVDRIQEGYTFLAFSLDILFLGNSCRDQMKLIKENI
jgi:2-dehydro-3-deoxyglucarate aldolase